MGKALKKRVPSLKGKVPNSPQTETINCQLLVIRSVGHGGAETIVTRSPLTHFACSPNSRRFGKFPPDSLRPSVAPSPDPRRDGLEVATAVNGPYFFRDWSFFSCYGFQGSHLWDGRAIVFPIGKMDIKGFLWQN